LACALLFANLVAAIALGRLMPSEAALINNISATFDGVIFARLLIWPAALTPVSSPP
jgi:hypothetical protein